MSKSKGFKLKESILVFFLVIVLCHCAGKIYVRQLPSFSPEGMGNMAIIADFTSSKGDIVNISRSKDLGDKLVEEASKRLRKKRYVLAKRKLKSVGICLEGDINVLDERGNKLTIEAPIYVDKNVDQDLKLKEALVSSFKKIEAVIEPYKGKKVPEDFLHSADVFLGEDSKLLGQYLEADSLVFLFAWEIKQTTATRLAYSMGYAGGMALGGALSASMYKTEYYEPDILAIALLYAAVGFVTQMTMIPDGYTACCGVVVETETGKATWYNFSHWFSGGLSGDRIGRLVRNFLKEMPERR